MLALVLKFLHIAAAMVMIAGIIGREVIRGAMRQTDDIGDFQTMAKLLTPFDRWMVQPGSMLIVLFGVILAVVQGFPLLGFLQGASANWLLVSWVIFALTIPLVPLIFIPRGKRFEAALQDAIQQGRVTEELTAAMSDPVDQAGHRAEEIAIAVVVFLMVVKPF